MKELMDARRKDREREIDTQSSGENSISTSILQPRLGCRCGLTKHHCK
jgi:hypothetical protein